MNKIEIKVLNPESTTESEKMMVCAARLTQRGHNIRNMDEFMKLYEKKYSDDIVKSLVGLPHPTIQKLGVINIVVVGASRRFLSQLRSHQNEVKFVSASLQYSDYSGNADFCIPYEMLGQREAVKEYISECQKAMEQYKSLIMDYGITNDAAGYIAPQGLRNILIISATPYQWKHMIRQRTCRRNTLETRYVLLKIWEELLRLNPHVFEDAGPLCAYGVCMEGKMTCGSPMKYRAIPSSILKEDFPFLYSEVPDEN